MAVKFVTTMSGSIYQVDLGLKLVHLVHRPKGTLRGSRRLAGADWVAFRRIDGMEVGKQLIISFDEDDGNDVITSPVTNVLDFRPPLEV